MFKVLKRVEVAEESCFTCTIGAASKMTMAAWHVTSPDDVISLLCDLEA